MNVSIVAAVALGALPFGRAHVANRSETDSLPPVQVEDLLSSKTLADWSPGLSSDGQWVTYAVVDPARARTRSAPDTTAPAYTPTWLLGSGVYVVHLPDRQTIRVMAGAASSWGPVWSPDGTTVAFLSDRAGAPQVWLWDRTSGGIRALSAASVRGVDVDAVIRWSPDSRSLVIPVAPESKGRPAMPAVRCAPRGTGDTSLSVTVYRALASGGSAGTPPPGLMARTHDTSPSYVSDLDTRNRRADLALIDIHSGHLSRIIRDVAPMWYAFSPDGRWLAFAHARGAFQGNDWRYGYDLILCTRDGHCRTLAHDIQTSSTAGWGMGLAWTPDSRGLLYVGSDDALTPHVYLVSLTDTAGMSVDASTHPLVERGASAWIFPLWDGPTRRVYALNAGALRVLDIDTHTTREIARVPGHRMVQILSSRGTNVRGTLPGTQVMLVSVLNDSTNASGVYAVDLATAAFRRIRETEASPVWADAFDVSDDGRTILFGSQGAARPLDLWVTDSAFRTQERVSDLNSWTRERRLGRSQLIQWRSGDGQVLRGALLLPAGYHVGARCPLVVLVYGRFLGSNAVYNFGLWPYGTQDNMQLLASRGYAVLLPDLPERVGTPMIDIAKDVVPGVDKVIELGIADPDRLGIMGQSYGGYATLATIVQTTRFKAAVVRAGIVDLLAEYGMMGADGSSFAVGVLEDGQGLMRGTPWQYRDRYLENSPVMHLDRVRTPVLIVHGTADTAVPVSQGDELFVDLRRLANVDVEYARYAGEGHGLQGYANQRDYLSRMLGWFDRHLQAQADTTESGRSEEQH